MKCTIQGIADSVAAEDKGKVEKAIRQIRDMSETEKAELSNTHLAFLTRVIKNLEPTIDGQRVQVLDLERTEDGEFTMKYKLVGDGTVLETEIRNVADFDTKSSEFSLDKQSLETLYSDYDSVNMFDDFEELARDITNSPEKILEVAEALVEADEHHNEESHYNTLRDQLNRITSTLVELVPNLNIHINNAGEKNFGQINIQTNDIYIEKGIGGSKSLMEIYVHELYHAVTHFAITGTSTETRGATARMEQVRDNFLSQTKEADLVRTSGETITEEEAGRLLDHLSNPQTGLHEFVALSMTNKAVMNQLKTLDVTKKKEQGNKNLFYRLADALNDIFQAIVRTVTKEPKGDDFSRMVFLVSRLQHAHKKPLEAKRLVSIRNLLSFFTPLERRWEDFLNRKEAEMKEDEGRNKMKKGEGDLRYLIRLAARAFYDEQAKDIIADTLSLASIKGGYNPFRPEGTLRSTLRDMRAADQTQIDIEHLGMMSAVVDQQREYRAIYTAQVVLQSFTRPLTLEEETVLTDVVLDTDLTSIFELYDIESLLGSNGKIDSEVKQILAKIKELSDPRSLNFYDMQTSLLANYLNNHEDHIALLKNAENIARKLGTDEVVDPSPELIALIDELTTLKALRKVPKAKRAVVQKLMREETQGVTNLLAFQKGQKQAAEEALFSTASDRINMIKGYSVQVTNQDIEVTTAPLNRRKELEAQGYKLVQELGKHELDNNTAGMGLFVNNKYVMQNFHRVGLRMTDKGRRGTTITESYSKSGDAHPTLRAVRDIRDMRDRRKAVIEQMHEGTYDPEAVPGDSVISPVFNKVGKVADFTYGMNKDAKIDLLEMERKVSTVMGRTAASTYDKEATETFNKAVLDLIQEDAEKNLTPAQQSIIGKNSKEYITISKDSPNEQVRGLWRILPQDVKNKYPDGFTLRRDLMYSYLGYRELSLADLPIIKQFFDANPKAYKAALKHALQFAEKLWQELIKISKMDIIIRTPGVFIGNVVSNFMLMYVSGYSFKEITQLKLQGIKELNKFVEGMKQSVMLGAKVEAGIATKEEMRRLDVINNNIQNSPVKDLVDAGFYTTILEEIEHGADTASGSYFNRLAKKKLSNMPKIFSDGIDLLYITENTKLFKMVEKGVQASDFAARYAQYHLMLEEGAPKDKAINAVRDNFINYNKPNSRFVEWANQMGFIMFTKYFTRIQRVIHRYGKTHPIKLFLSIIAQDYIFGELDTFDDQSILSKDMGNLFYNPWDNMMRVFTPTSFEAVDWLLNGKG